MKRLALILLASLAAALLFSACHPKPSRQGAIEIRIATQPAPIYAPIFVVKQKQWLEKEFAELGVKVKWSSFVAGPPENESFFAGQQDVGVIGDTPAIVARAAGLNSRVIGMAATGPKALAVVARADSSIQSPADLKGKKVGVTKGSYAHHLLYLVLQRAGLKSEDISLIHLPPADLVTAFASGDIAAAATWEPFLSRIEVNGARRIVDGTGIKQGALVIFAVDEFAQKNADLVEKLLNAYQRGAEYIKANPKEAAALIAPEVRLDPDQVERLFPIFNYDPVVRSEHIAELKATEEFLRTNGLSKERVNIDSFTDSRYLLRAGIR